MTKNSLRTPRVRPVNNKALEKNSGDLLLDGFLVRLGKEVEESAREVVSVTVRISQL